MPYKEDMGFEAVCLYETAKVGESAQSLRSTPWWFA